MVFKLDAMLKKVVITVITFFYIYNIKFINVPLTSRQIMALSTIVFMLPMMGRQSLFRMRWLLKPLCIGISILMVSVVSSFYNDEDIIGTFFNIPMSVLSNALACLFIIKIGWVSSFRRKYGIDVFVFAILVHNILALLFYISPSLRNVIFSIVDVSFNEATGVGAESNIFTYRLIGLGEGIFFSGGIISSYGLLCSTYMMFSRGRGRVRYEYIVFFLIILITGIFISRTTYLGLLLSAIFALVNVGRLKLMSWLLAAVSALLLGLTFIHYTLTKVDSQITQWGYEVFYNMLKYSEIETSSTNVLLSMFIFPSSLKTWLIGDCLYSMAGGGYYMGIDVGYLRIIYGIGLIGLVLIIYLHYYLFKQMKTKPLDSEDSINRSFALALFFIFLIANLKGVSLQYGYLLFFVISSSWQTKRIVN